MPRLWRLSRQAVTETRTVSVPVRVPSHPGLVKHGRMTDRVSTRQLPSAESGQVSSYVAARVKRSVKPVGYAFPGSNPGPATTSGNGLWPGVPPGSRAAVRCVILCHRRSGDVAAPRWLRTYSGRIRGWRSGSPNRLLCPARARHDFGRVAPQQCLQGRPTRAEMR